MGLRKRWMWTGAAALVFAALAGLIWALNGPYTYARIATGYAAKQTCSCLHISGRTLESCIADFPADARGAIRVSQAGDEVRASVLFGAVSAAAAFEESYGCRLLN